MTDDSYLVTRTANRFRTPLVVLLGVLCVASAHGARELSGREIAQTIRPAVVKVSAEGENHRRFWFNDEWGGDGSGFIFRRDQQGNLWILTNSHVLGFDHIAEVGGDSAPAVVRYSLSVQMADERPAEIVRVLEHEELDAAILVVKAEGKKDKVLSVASEAVQVGDQVYAMGHALGGPAYFTRGIVSELNNEEGVIGTDAAINLGNSGGPLVNQKGQVVGVNTYGIDGAEAMGYAIQIGKLLDVERYKEVDVTDLEDIERHINALYFEAE